MGIELQTLTPLWTGGADGKVDRIHETGLLGSLRWWYEVMVRGTGGEVCDTVSSGCVLDDRKVGLCDVCQLFGATGWRRRFRLSLAHNQVKSMSDFPQKITASPPRIRGSGTGQPSWYFQYQDDQMRKPNSPMSGSFSVHIQSLVPTFPAEVIAGLVQFVADWTAIGARAQMGFGVSQVQGERVDTAPLYNHLAACQGSKTYSNLPSLNNMFLARIQVTNQQPQETFNLKYDLRALFRGNTTVRHFIMGTVDKKSPVGPERMAAKIKMSHPYGDGLMRVWGWVPALPKGAEMERDEVLTAIHAHLESNYPIECWREMNSDRDTQTKQQTDASAFLRSLLQGEDTQP
ncbi:MAG: type III-B CRISPR module RAMP protein Cmr1 [Chloroflexaceae bacterium]|nr:type III-B CRISPR module RAMP protein Cmr1 [Chloroflexaceae bacterium]